MKDSGISIKNKKFNSEYMLIIVILILGIFLRFFHLGKESFWLDEAYTASLIQQNTYSIVTTTAADVHPPLFYLILHFISSLIGTTEFSLRLPSALFGLLALYVVWILGRQLFSKNVALLAAFLLAISPLHIQYSQEARANSLLVLSVLSSYTFLLFLKKEKKYIFGLGYFISTAIVLWTHNLGFIYIGLQVIWVLLEGLLGKRGEFPWKKWFAALGMVILSYSPWISIVINQVKSVGSGSYWLGFAIWQNFANSYISFSSSILGFILIIPLILYISCINIKDINFRGMLLWAILTPFFIWTISTFLIPVFITRNILPSLPAFLLLAALSLTMFRYKPINAALIVVFSISCIFNLYPYYTTVQKDQWREVAAYFQKNIASEDQVYFDESFGKTGLDWYLDDSAYQVIDTPDNQAWLVIYTDKEDKIQTLTKGREITEYKNIILAHPMVGLDP